MRTLILLIASAFFAAAVFTSCQKQDDLVEEQAAQQKFDRHWVGDKGASTGSIGYKEKPSLTNFPNPFKEYTYIQFEVPRPMWVTITVTNLREQFTMRLVSEFKNEGLYRERLDAHNLPPGLYVAEMQLGSLVVKTYMIKESENSSGGIISRSR
jgi:hypothetical protein